MQTKWDLINEAERNSLQATPFAKPCAHCDVYLLTEADFAKHFVVPDAQYKNSWLLPKPMD